MILSAIAIWFLQPVFSPAASLSDSFFVRGAYGRDSSRSGFEQIAATGFNITHVNPYISELNKVQNAGLKARVSLGDYDASTCSFTLSDTQVVEAVTRVKDHPAVHSYKLADEPSSIRCPGEAPTEMRARDALVKSLDPTHPTTVTLTTRVNYADWVGAADILDFVVYICNDREIHPNPGSCSFGKIDTVIGRAEAAAVPRYWATLQAHDGHSVGNHFRWPSVEELREEFSRWDASLMEGYFVWCWARRPCPSNIETRPELMDELREQNARDFSGGSVLAATPRPILLGAGVAVALGMLLIFAVGIYRTGRRSPSDAADYKSIRHHHERP